MPLQRVCDDNFYIRASLLDLLSPSKQEMKDNSPILHQMKPLSHMLTAPCVLSKICRGASA